MRYGSWMLAGLCAAFAIRGKKARGIFAFGSELFAAAAFLLSLTAGESLEQLLLPLCLLLLWCLALALCQRTPEEDRKEDAHEL